MSGFMNSSVFDQNNPSLTMFESQIEFVPETNWGLVC